MTRFQLGEELIGNDVRIFGRRACTVRFISEKTVQTFGRAADEEDRQVLDAEETFTDDDLSEAPADA